MMIGMMMMMMIMSNELFSIIIIINGHKELVIVAWLQRIYIYIYTGAKGISFMRVQTEKI